MNRLKNRKKSRGFNIIEIMIALVILLVGFSGIANLLLGTMNSNNFSHNMTTADNMTTNLIEFWKSTEYQQVEKFLNAGDGSSNIYTTEETPSFSDSRLTNTLTSWQTFIDDNLPQGRGVVTINSTSMNSVASANIEIKVQWVQKGKLYDSTKTLFRSNI